MQGRPTEIDRIFGLCGGVLAAVGSVGLLILVGLTVTGVVWRYALNDPIFGLIDISTMASSVVVACAVAWAAVKQAHVTIELIESHLGQSPLRLIGRIIDTLTGLLFCFAAYALYQKSICGFACGDITDNLAIGHRPFYIALAVSMGFCAVLSFWRVLRIPSDTSQES